MVDLNSFRKIVSSNSEIASADDSKPFSLRADLVKNRSVGEYCKTVKKEELDLDRLDILHKIEYILKLSPKNLKIPYSFNIKEINGEHFYDENKNLVFIRDYDSELVIDYYPSSNNKNLVNKIIETDKYSGQIISKIKPVYSGNEIERITVIIFDTKINHKYIMLQLNNMKRVETISVVKDGVIDFKTLVLNSHSFLPEKYIETFQNEKGQMEVIDCKLNPMVYEIKKTTESKIVFIKYVDGKKITSVKRRMPEL